MAKFAAPGPLTVRLLLMSSGPWAKVIVPVTPKVIVSPEFALAITDLRVPGEPSSAREVTILVLFLTTTILPLFKKA
jgi:hypothetical protein